jgi:hypothetical protein
MQCSLSLSNHSAWYRKKFYGNTNKNQATTQQHLWYHDLFSQTVCLYKAMSKISFLSFSAALTCKVWKKWNIIFFKNCYNDMHCCRWHIFTIKALLCISIFLYIWQWHITQKHTECILVFPWKQWLSKRATMLRNTCIAYLEGLPHFCTNITHVTETCDFKKSTTYSNESLGNVAKCKWHHPASQPEENNSSNLCFFNAKAHLLIFCVSCKKQRQLKPEAEGMSVLLSFEDVHFQNYKTVSD